jgi:hypothetical protein
MRRELYADALNRALPFNSSVLEVGCGTDSSTTFSVSVPAGDRRGHVSQLAAERFGANTSSRVRFVQMNLFRRASLRPVRRRPLQRVPHHTGDPRGGGGSCGW